MRRGSIPRWIRAVFVLNLVLACPLSAQLDPFDVARVRQIDEVAIAPDGRHVAYTVQVPRDLSQEENGPVWLELHVAAWGEEGRPYVDGEVRVGKIAWLPDGSGITYLAEREGDEHEALYLVPLAGGESRRLVALESEIDAYSLAPDGTRVALLAEEPPTAWEREAEEIGFTQEVYAEGKPFVRVWIAPLKRDGERPGARGESPEEGSPAPRRLELPGSASELHWSPAGDRLAVALAPSPLVDDRYTRRQIHVVGVEAGRVHGTVEPRGKLGAVRWSPDGEHLAAISAVDAHDPREGRLMVVGAEGGALRDLTPDLQGHVQAFAWLDAERLLTVVGEGVHTVVDEIELASTERRRRLQAGDLIWEDLAVSEDGARVALSGSSSAHPTELFGWTPRSGEPERMTRSNPWLDDRQLGRQEVITWTARDGLELQGLLIYPLEYREGVQYPLVLSVHGGPESHRSDGWLTSYSRPGQVAASAGMAVLYPNYRGSTGRGLEFSKLSQGDPAGAEFDDLVDAVDHLIQIGLADPDAIGITGGSYGGYATAWASTRYSDRFAAGVMFVGISDQMFSTLQGDIPHEHRLVHFLGWPWDEWQELLEASPIYHTENVQTPLLIVGGDADTRVNPAQSLALYNALKVRSSAPVRYVRYPGEKHGNRRAAFRLDYNLRMMRWLKHFLVEGGSSAPPYRLDYGGLVQVDEDSTSQDGVPHE